MYRSVIVAMGFEKIVDEMIPKMLNVFIVIGVLSLAVTIISYVILSLKHKSNKLNILGKGFIGGSAIIISALIIKLLHNYEFYYSPKFEIPISFILFLLGFMIINYRKKDIESDDTN